MSRYFIAQTGNGIEQIKCALGESIYERRGIIQVLTGPSIGKEPSAETWGLAEKLYRQWVPAVGQS